jgi:hypothetical protein
LTYGFRGIDVDICDLVKRCQRSSFESAARFLTSSRLKTGSFQIPVNLDGDDETFAQQLAELPRVAEVAARVEVGVGIIDVPNQTDRLPYPEYFEVIRKRINEIAGVFSAEDLRTGIALDSIKATGAKQFRAKQLVLCLIRGLGSAVVERQNSSNRSDWIASLQFALAICRTALPSSQLRAKTACCRPRRESSTTRAIWQGLQMQVCGYPFPREAAVRIQLALATR